MRIKCTNGERLREGNSHFALIENNRRQVLDLIRTWIERRVPAAKPTA